MDEEEEILISSFSRHKDAHCDGHFYVAAD